MSTLTSADVVFDKVHFRHDRRWSVQPRQGGLFCLACAAHIIDTEHIASVRKSFALSSVSGILKSSPGTLRELLQQDNRVCLRFIATILGVFQTMDDPVTLEKADQVLVQLLSELQNEQSVHFVLDNIHKQVSDQLSVKSFLPALNFLGNLVKAVPNVAHSLVTQYVPLLDHLCSFLLYPAEALKTSVMYVWLQLLGTAGDTVAQSLPATTRDRLCIRLLQTLANGSAEKLIRNCAGLLWQLVQLSEAVSVLMSSQGAQIMCDETQDILTNNSQIPTQNQEQQPTEHCPLPLLLKKLLLSGDETLKVTSVKCIAAILVHSPSQYSVFFIKADVPGFLFDQLASSSNEMLLLSIYSCLLLLTEDQLFFSQCHSIYGIESLLRSIKEGLQLTNSEVPKHGFLLLTQILERQPPSLPLFPSGSGFVAVSEAVMAGVASSCWLVAIEAVSAATALFRLNHQSRPVQYEEVKGLVKAISSRFSELRLPFPGPLRYSAAFLSCATSCLLPPPSSCSAVVFQGTLRRSDTNSQTFGSKKYFLQALVCFEATCRLAEECASEPVLMENPFTAPHKHNDAQHSVESLCQCLLRCCDSVWIPAVQRMCECEPSAMILQPFYSILSSQFTLLPSLMPAFANKLASSGFFRLALNHKSLLCAGSRNPGLNASCCGFLQKLSMCLLSESDPPFGNRDCEEVETLLQSVLPSLCRHLSEWPILMCDYQEPRATQYCLVIMLYLALQQGNRLLPDQKVFSSVVWLLHSVQDQCSSTMPHSVFRSALYLLAVTQDKSSNLDGPALKYISKALSSCQSFASLYFHHPALLHFICRYPELVEKFGSLVLELWLTKQTQHTKTEHIRAVTQEDNKQDQEPNTETMELLALMKKYPDVILTLLDIACTREAPLAERVLGVLELHLHDLRDHMTDLCTNLRSALLQALQRISVESMGHGIGQGHTTSAVNSLPLVLKLLCVTQATDPPLHPLDSNMEGLHFKLLYHVSNIVGSLKPINTESLLPAFNYLHSCLSLSPAHITDRAVSMLLSNSGLMDQLQTVISSSTTPSPPPSACPPPALLCCGHLLLSSLVTLQHIHSSQVNKSISWSLDTAVDRLLVKKRNTDSLLLVSHLKLLQALLDVDLASAVVCLSTGPGLVGPRPLGVEGDALYPLGSTGALCLTTALSGLLLQKHELLLRASVNCLASLLAFLKRKSLTTAEYVVCQPWTRFLLRCLLSSGESCLLHPAILRLLTILLQCNSTSVLWEPDLLRVMETVERKGVKELGPEAAVTLSFLLTQIEAHVALPPDEHKLRVRRMVEALEPQTSAQTCNPSVSSTILHVGDVTICMSDFTLKTGR